MSPPFESKGATERGLVRARRVVEELGQSWSDVTQIEQYSDYRQALRRYGLPNSISEEFEDHQLFGRSGALFIDDKTGRVVAYAPSSVLQKPQPDLAPEC